MKVSNSPWVLVGIMALSGCDTNNTAGETTVLINVPAITLNGAFSLNNDLFPASQYENGVISLADINGSEARLGNTYSGSYQAKVVAGNYQTQYRHSQGGEQVPVNRGSAIALGLSLLEDQELDINATAYQVELTFTLNGMTFPASEYDDALFYLQPQGGGERILLGNSHAAIPPVMLMPGEYDVIYELQTPGPTVPLNQNAIVGDLAVIDQAINVAIDVKATEFRLSVELDGADFPKSQYNDGNFLLRSSTGDTAELGDSYNLPFTVNVIEGTYDLIYSHETGADVPANTAAIILGDQVINQSTPAVITNIETILITPVYTLDGEPFPISEYQDANIFLRSANQSDLFLLGNTHDPVPAAVRMIPGTYDVIYRHETGNLVPQNTNAVVVEAIFLDNTTTLPVAVHSAIAAASFTLNQESFTTSQAHYGQFFLQGSEVEDFFFLGNSYDGSGTVLVIPGTYDVVYQHLAGGQVPRNKHATIVSGAVVSQTTGIDVDVEATRIKPAFWLNGFAFPAAMSEHAQFVMRESDERNEVFLGRSFFEPASLLAVKGSYEVFYEYLSGSSIPVNESKKVRDLVLP